MNNIFSPNMDRDFGSACISMFDFYPDEELLGLAFIKGNPAGSRPQGATVLAVTTLRLMFNFESVLSECMISDISSVSVTDAGYQNRMRGHMDGYLNYVTTKGREVSYKMTGIEDARFIGRKIRSVSPIPASGLGIIIVEKIMKISAILLSIAIVLGVCFSVYLAGSSILKHFSGNEDSARCEELKNWYQSAPYDSNKQIAQEYYRACQSTPPPVINGELEMSDIN